MPARVAIAGRTMRTTAPSLATIVSAKNISLDRNPLSSGTPAMAAAETVASVAVIGIACDKAAQTLQITRAGLVIDDARRHEEGGLESGMIHHVKHRGDKCQRTIHAQQQSDQPQVTDGRIRQHAFHVALKERCERAEQQRTQPRAADDPEPQFGACQHRPQTRKQENAGFHHRRRMQIGRHRRWRRHRMR